MNKLNYIDLFAGAGGLSVGFIQAGFNPIAYFFEGSRTAAFKQRGTEVPPLMAA